MRTHAHAHTIKCSSFARHRTQRLGRRKQQHRHVTQKKKKNDRTVSEEGPTQLWSPRNKVVYIICTIYRRSQRDMYTQGAIELHSEDLAAYRVRFVVGRKSIVSNGDVSVKYSIFFSSNK